MLTEKCLDLPEKSCAILHRTELTVGVGNDYKSMRFAGSFQRDIHRVGLLKRYLEVSFSMQHQQRNLEIGCVQAG